MSNYRSDGAAARERARVLEEELGVAKSTLAKREAEIDAQEDELDELKAKIRELEASRRTAADVSRSAERSGSKVAQRKNRVVAVAGTIVLTAFGIGTYVVQAEPSPGQARIYVGNRDIDKATFIVEGDNAPPRRCTAKVCDFKLPPGRYRVRAESGPYRGSTEIVVRSSHSLAKPIMLTK